MTIFFPTVESQKATTKLGRWTVRGKNSSLDCLITTLFTETRRPDKAQLQFIIQAAMSGDFLQSLLDPLSIPQICRRLRKPGLKPDLCAFKGLRNDAVILG